MKKFGCVFGLCVSLSYAGFSSGSVLSESTLLDYRHQFIPFQGKDDALGWLEVSNEAKEPIVLEVSGIHLRIIQPIWSIDRDEGTLLSAFGIANQSAFDVLFDTSKHRVTFSSIASMSSSSFITGIFQSSQSTLSTKGDLKFSSITHQGSKGSSFGFFGGSVRVSEGEILFENINAEYQEAYGANADLIVEGGGSVEFERIQAGADAYGIVGKLENKGAVSFGEIRAGDHLFGYRGDAYGIVGGVENQESLWISLIRAKNGGDAYGIKADVKNDGEILIEKIHSLEGDAYGLLGSLSGGGRMQIKEIQAGSSIAGGDVYGIYAPSTIMGDVEFITLQAIRDYKGVGGRVYGIYSPKDLQIKDSKILFSSILADEIFPIYSSGMLEIEDSSLIFGSEMQKAILSLNGGEVVLKDATLSAKEGMGIYASGVSKLRVLSGGDVWIDTPDKALSGRLNVLLEPKAKLSFKSDADIDVLRANDNATLEIRSNSATLNIQDFQANNSNFILASTLKTSDKIIIHSTSATETLKNNLYVKLYEVSSFPNYVLLVSMPKELGSKIIFNELIESSTQTRAISYVGFDEVEVEIKRHDTEESVYYYSDLIAKNIQISQNFLLPTQVALNANHSLFLLNNDSLDLRMGELRGGIEGSGLWGRINFGRGIEKMQKESNIEYFSFQAGYDYDFSLLEASNFLGIFGGYLRGVNTQEGSEYQGINATSGSYEVITQGLEIGIYNSYVRDRGLFSDSVAKLSAYSSKAQMPYEISSNCLDTYALSLSQELGYRFALPKNIFVDIQSDVGLSYLSAQDFLQKLEIEGVEYTLDSKQKALWVLKSKSGLSVGYQWSKEDLSLELNAGGFYAFHSFYGGERMYLSSLGTRVSNNPYSNNHQGILNVGIDLSIKERSKLYFDFEKSFGGKLIKDFSLNFGARFALGKIPQRGRPQEEDAPLDTLD